MVQCVSAGGQESHGCSPESKPEARKVCRNPSCEYCGDISAFTAPTSMIDQCVHSPLLLSSSFSLMLLSNLDLNPESDFFIFFVRVPVDNLRAFSVTNLGMHSASHFNSALLILLSPRPFACQLPGSPERERPPPRQRTLPQRSRQSTQGESL